MSILGGAGSAPYRAAVTPWGRLRDVGRHPQGSPGGGEQQVDEALGGGLGLVVGEAGRSLASMNTPSGPSGRHDQVEPGDRDADGRGRDRGGRQAGCARR